MPLTQLALLPQDAKAAPQIPPIPQGPNLVEPSALTMNVFEQQSLPPGIRSCAATQLPPTGRQHSLKCTPTGIGAMQTVGSSWQHILLAGSQVARRPRHSWQMLFRQSWLA